MYRTLCYIILIICFGCGSSIQKKDLKQLNGYWEIKEVEFANGQTKEYGMSTTIDYIALDGMMGFRKKVQPQLDGSYTTSNDAENFRIVEKDGVMMILYEEGAQQWEEVVTAIGKNSFSVRNRENNSYHYKRYEPINLQP